MTLPANIAERLSIWAARQPDCPAVIVPNAKPACQAVYRQIDTYFANLAAGLSSKGIHAGMRVAVMIPPGGGFMTITLALLRLAAVPVLIDPGMGIRGLGRCIAEAAPEAFIGTGNANLARMLFRWGRKTIRLVIPIDALEGDYFVDDIIRDGAAVPLAPAEPVDDSQPAAILFTSGSTGPAKGVVYIHGMFQEQVRVLAELFHIEPGEIDLCTFPLFALFAPALGMTSVVPDMNPTRPAKADPRKLVQAIHEHGVTNLFGSPALLDVLGRYGEGNRVELPTVRRVISAGAPVSAQIVERIVKMLPAGVQVFTPYGATEALPIAVIGSNEILGETRHLTDRGAGVCVGRPVGRTEVRIIPTDDRPLTLLPPALPVGHVGEITVRGPVVSRQYWNRPDSDALHKIADEKTLWHRTGDLGYFDAAGRLWFCGRKAQRVVIEGETLHTVQIEGVFNTHPAVFRTALVGVVRDGVTCPVLCVELEPTSRADRDTVRRELLELAPRFAPAGRIRDILFHRGFPVDIRHNAKIGREKLAVWAARRVR